jgi:hypothetical protein
MQLNILRPQLENLFKPRPVRLAYLFGSRAAGAVHAESDIDIAVLLDDSLSPDERFSKRLSFTGDLSQVFNDDQVDVVVLKDASPLLAYEVLRGGILLYCSDEEERIGFQVRTLLIYEDTAPLRDLLAEAMTARVQAGEFGKSLLPGNFRR